MEKDYTCSFCGKSQKEVKRIVAGPSVYICNECISLCIDIMAEDGQFCRYHMIDNCTNPLCIVEQVMLS